MKMKLKGRNKRCPDGVICVENLTFYVVLIGIVVGGYFLYQKYQKNIIVNYHVNQGQQEQQERQDVLLNPYTPPLKDESYNVHYNRIRNSINKSTNIGSAHNAKFRQVGLLSNDAGAPVPLMGKPLFTNRDKWQYYSMSDQFNSMKIPLTVNGKNGMSEYGCDKVYDGDNVYLKGIKEVYVVTLYENDHLQYLPSV